MSVKVPVLLKVPPLNEKIVVKSAGVAAPGGVVSVHRASTGTDLVGVAADVQRALKVVVAAPVMVPPVQVAAPPIGVVVPVKVPPENRKDVVWLPPLRLTVPPLI